MDRVECQQADDWALLRVHLRSHAASAAVDLLAEHLEGDALRLQPPSDPGLLPLAGFSSDVARMPRFTFAPACLKARAMGEWKGARACERECVRCCVPLSRPPSAALGAAARLSSACAQSEDEAAAFMDKFHPGEAFESATVSLGTVEVTGLPKALLRRGADPLW